MTTSLAAPGQPADGAPIPIRLIEAERRDDALADLSERDRTWIAAQGFTAAPGAQLALPDEEGRLARILLGLGDAEARARGRFTLGVVAAAARPGLYRIETALDAEAAEEAALAWLLAGHRYDRFKPAPAPAPAALIPPEGVDAARIEALAAGAALARRLINEPANVMGPAALQAEAEALAAAHGAEIRVIAGEDLLTGNFPLIHTVGAAAAEAPRLIDLRWGRADAPKVALVGKGVCFDTGGLDLKPAAAMRLMKKDMGGAANVLGLAAMIMATGLDIALRVLIPAVENSVASAAFRPGDVLTSRKGLTVEIGNTDAEGRLVLADALALADEEAPALILDMATLTGAARVALGPDLPPFFTDDEGLAADLAEAARRMRDPLWRLPLHKPYEADIEPAIADLDNAPGGGMAGAITAALFLRRFVSAAPHVHFDIFGWRPAATPGQPKGGACQAAFACFALLESRYGRT